MVIPHKAVWNDEAGKLDGSQNSNCVPICPSVPKVLAFLVPALE